MSVPSRSFAFAVLLPVLAATFAMPAAAQPLPAETLDSVVSVLPVWPDRPQGGQGAPPGTTPEGSGVVVGPDGLIATAWHVIEPAERIDVRLADGRIVPAQFLGFDAASDIALLQVGPNLPSLMPAPPPRLAEEVCAIGNAYGLGLSVTCGVVSAIGVSNAGFNPVEDFVQTDAAANPGSSGGALVDRQGRLVGMVSAIFASQGDTNIGVNFAVSQALLARVVADLADDGQVAYVSPGWRLGRLSRAQQAEVAAARVAAVEPEGAAAAAGVQPGDLLLEVSGRRVTSPRDALSALALVTPGGEAGVRLLRDDEELRLTLAFPGPEAAASADLPAPPAPTGGAECPHPLPVCAARQAVFPVESFDPLASAVRIAPDLLVTNRHVVGDRSDATVLTPGGPLPAEVVPSAYRGDLALLRVEGLPVEGAILDPSGGNTGNDWADEGNEGPFFAVGADIARQEVRVFAPGTLILPPADEAPLGRLHVTARMQPGVSGGALVDGAGRLVGIAVGGGEGRFEALPLAEVRELLDLRDAPDAAAVQAALGAALSGCADAVAAAQQAGRGPLPGQLALALAETCRASQNVGQFLEAGRILGMGGEFGQAIALHAAAVEQVPNSINARIALLVSLQLGGRIEEMLPHARWLLSVAPDDPQAQRFAIQAGVWGGDPELAERAYALLVGSNPRQAEAARRFIDAPPPPPGRR